jgi:hypothetical protein
MRKSRIEIRYVGFLMICSRYEFSNVISVIGSLLDVDKLNKRKTMHRRKRLNLGSMMIVQSDLAHFPTII